MKRVLVIGGAGFIGSNLCKELVKEHTVVSLDNYFTGSEENHIDGVEYIRGEAREINYLLGNSKPFDLVFHFGEYSRVEQSYTEPTLVFKYNNQLIDVLEYCKRTSAKLIYSGSSTKFADNAQHLSPYTWSKIKNTELITAYNEWYGLNYAIVYFYNVYGVSELAEGKYATLIAKFLRMAKSNEPLTVVKPGTQKRNFTHISDVISALLLVAEKGQGDNYGIGSDEEYSVLDVAHLLSDKIEYLPERKGNRLSAPVLSKKTKDLGWEPKIKLSDYLKENL